MHNQESKLGKGVQGAKPPAGARGVPASFPFPKKGVDSALAILAHPVWQRTSPGFSATPDVPVSPHRRGKKQHHTVDGNHEKSERIDHGNNT